MASEKALKIGNVLAFLIFAIGTGYALFGRDHVADIFHGYETYFDPGITDLRMGVAKSGAAFALTECLAKFIARWVFIIWAAVHILLLGFVAYQWTDEARDSVTSRIDWLFVISALLNAFWFNLLEGNHVVVALIVSILTILSVSVIYYNLAEHRTPGTWGQIVFIHAPFSVWHGLIVFMSVLNAFVAFTSVPHDDTGEALPPDAFHLVLVYIAFIFLALAAVMYVEYKKEQCDVAPAWVIALCLWAVYDKQHDQYIRWPALAAAIVATLIPIKVVASKVIAHNRIRSEQEQPLLS
ncbi:hypothetical protein BX666DRAFT_2026325 [Dichotomocladium elegans]|nr:hypothetical protein BX666DRAFT_2026325 [Dichotomocladium elegans]